jgi:hypothetical protein
MKTKICKFCNVEKAFNEFPFRGNHYLKTCSSCYNEKENLKNRIRYAEDTDYRVQKIIRNRHAQWRSKYRVEPEVVYKTFELQQGKCANLACEAEISLDIHSGHSIRAHVDHDHTTGQFRTLLCNRCNIVLGHIEKNRDVVEFLLKYADKYSEISHKGLII